MQAVVENKMYRQQYPIDAKNPTVIKEIDARQLWNKIIQMLGNQPSQVSYFGILFKENLYPIVTLI